MPQSHLTQSFRSKKRSGVSIPLFCVYSKNSFGSGDLSDLKLVIDWALISGNTIVQLLPMNEMAGVFCPYDSLSAFALEPLYISLTDLPLPKDKSLKRQIETLRKNLSVALATGGQTTAFWLVALATGGQTTAFRLANKGHLDYRVKEEKMRLCREIFLMRGAHDAQELNRFKSANVYWLSDFSLFKVLKATFRNSAWYDWPLEFRNREGKALDKFREEHAQEITFEEWLQWQLYEQFKQIKDYAGRKKVFLNGDLPVLVSRDSSDVWSHQEFFKLEFASGAPPDMYCARGQRWGMPTYNWGRIEADGYRYLKERLKYAENFYDILRIDHVVGLFRIWSIPYNDLTENQGLNGAFDPVNESEWEVHGRKILEVMLSSTNMLLCAEDLGVIPKVCIETLEKLKIPGNDVQRWVKDWNIKHDFLKPQDYRKLAVTMLSTHDTTNWPAWWENEAGTIDEDLFRRKCVEAGIDFSGVKLTLFDISRSCHERLRWKEEIDSLDKLIKGLSPQGLPAGQAGTIPKERLHILIGLYQNTYGEKEKLWKHLGLAGPMREKCDREIFRAVLKLNLEAGSVFCINTIIDLLHLDDIWEGDRYQYRINTPGTVSDKNWSLRLPLSLEELLKHPVTKQIRQMVVDSGRI